ncbi:MAG TPA: hypothetical protein VJ831_07160 [Jatrophihabitantaceae bacterium]|nr:hypothetical protein [Jatrophihabitantaceae bacterium]
MKSYRNPANIWTAAGLIAVLAALAAIEPNLDDGLVILFGLGIVYVAARNVWPKLELTTAGFTLRNYRTRSFTWTDIENISTDLRYGTPHMWVTSEGRRIPCLAVSASPLGADWVDRAVAEIRAEWQRHHAAA